MPEREAEAGSPEPAATQARPEIDEQDQPEIDEQELIARLREQVGSLPAAALVTDAAMSLVPVAYVRLGLPPEEHAKYADLGEARVVIDALAGMLGAVAGRLGPYEREPMEALAHLRYAYADAIQRGERDSGPPPAAPSGEPPAPPGPATPPPPGRRPSGLWVPGQD